MSFEKKNKFAFWAYPQTMKSVEQHYQSDGCRSQSEFIEKAVHFYVAYLDEERHVDYLSPLITETVAATIKGTEQHITRILFKVTVELGKLSHIIAAAHSVDEGTLRQLHAMCINEVRKINGIIDCEEAVRFQKEE
ncbi:MAG: hypothetical protein E7496_06125 [Ruminococcus sp.]|nr:hypothetical protein [Ruminococcus sp.]